MPTKSPSRSRKTDAQQSNDGTGPGFALSSSEQGEVEEKSPPRPAVLHEVIRRQGEQELRRSAVALLLSAFAAGLTMGFSFVTRALLHRHLGDFPARFLFENLGYSVGFIIVIVARQQLFTENTMTAVLPLMTVPSIGKFLALLRLWGVVLAGNLIGVALFAYAIQHLQQVDDETQNALLGIGLELMRNSSWQMVTKGVIAGWLIATMVWMLANSEFAKLPIILTMTFLIAIGGCTHIVVGSAEARYLVFAGHLGLAAYVLDFALPTLLGNVVGGSLIFALISHAQVRSDVE
jgi:formate/nitrite transporter FocA (FNT family)